MTLATFLSSIYRLATISEFKAVDAIYDFIDDRLLAGEFSTCDLVLREIDPARLLPSCIISVLIVTRRAKEKLSESRSAFVAKSLAVLARLEGPEEASRLLSIYS